MAVTMWIIVLIIHVRSYDKKLEVSPVFYFSTSETDYIIYDEPAHEFRLY